jgi:FlaA1/EpsC-like NDP-sugar epimerase
VNDLEICITLSSKVSLWGNETVERNFMERRFAKLILDSFLGAVALLAAVSVHAGGVSGEVLSKKTLVWAVFLGLLRITSNVALGVYRSIWKYFSFSEAAVLARAFADVSIAVLVGQYTTTRIGLLSPENQLPLETLLLELFMSFGAALTVRAATKYFYERKERTLRRSSGNSRRIALYGAGRAGMLLYKELKGNSDFEIVGFLDDDPQKQGAVIVGLPVLGNRDDLGSITRRYRIDEIVISVASGHTASLSEVLVWCKKNSVSVKIIPSLEEIVERRAKIGQLREVQIEDLLGRQSLNGANWLPVMLESYQGQRILITGAGGSIGSELVRQLLMLQPARLGLLDRDENALYELEQELLFRFPDAPIEPIVADVRNQKRVTSVLAEFQPEWVFHAAAYKHVPLMEMHPCEGILNNVGGTWTLLEACRKTQVKYFVFISTDKAVNPTSVLGATKLIGERLARTYSNGAGLTASSVRFGNVAGSRGSVIPLFKTQIANGGPLTITHRDIVRFFMTVPEAVQLVLCAGTLGKKGDVFVLDMGNPRKVLELAHDIITLSGLVPEKDIPIVFTGLRPGEKLYEELTTSAEILHPTRFERVSRIEANHAPGEISPDDLETLCAAAENFDKRQALELMKSICANYKPAGHANANSMTASE